MNRYSETPEREIPVMERIGIYCMVFSMLEDRLETFWWNCSYVHKWDVIPSNDDPRLKRPPKRKEWEKRKFERERVWEVISRGERKTELRVLPLRARPPVRRGGGGGGMSK